MVAAEGAAARRQEEGLPVHVLRAKLVVLQQTLPRGLLVDAAEMIHPIHRRLCPATTAGAQSSYAAAATAAAAGICVEQQPRLRPPLGRTLRLAKSGKLEVGAAQGVQQAGRGRARAFQTAAHSESLQRDRLRSPIAAAAPATANSSAATTAAAALPVRRPVHDRRRSRCH